MNKLKFGHRVISWDNLDKGCIIKGRHVYTNPDGIHFILSDDQKGLLQFTENCKLDPNATEFLTGDEVEFSMDGEDWVNGIYGHYDSNYATHFNMEYGVYWKYCRYPKEKEEVNINVNEGIKVTEYYKDGVKEAYTSITSKWPVIDYLRGLTPEELAEIINEATSQ